MPTTQSTIGQLARASRLGVLFSVERIGRGSTGRRSTRSNRGSQSRQAPVIEPVQHICVDDMSKVDQRTGLQGHPLAATNDRCGHRSRRATFRA